MSILITPKTYIEKTNIPNVFVDDNPIIFGDTCSLLYYNSLIDLGAFKDFQWDKKISELIINDDVYSATSVVVLKEFNDHYDELRTKDAEKEIGWASSMKEYGKLVGGQEQADLRKGMNALHLSDKLDEMVRAIWRNTYVIIEDDTFYRKAHDRVVYGIAPSKI